MIELLDKINNNKNKDINIIIFNYIIKNNINYTIINTGVVFDLKILSNEQLNDIDHFFTTFDNGNG